eukprot:gene12500-26310_t
MLKILHSILTTGFLGLALASFHTPISPTDTLSQLRSRIIRASQFLLFEPIIVSSKVFAADRLNDLLDNEIYTKPLLNLPPNRFEYPSFFQAVWNIDLIYKDAKFTNAIEFNKLARDVNVPGFRKYSVGFLPDLGANIKTKWNFIPADSSSGTIIEDRSTNLKNIIEDTFQISNCIIDGIDYDSIKNPNRCSIQYHDQKANGKLELFTNYRKSLLKKNQFYSLEHIRQSSVRQVYGQRASQTIGDYAIEMILNFDSEKISPTNVNGIFRVISYLQPQDDLFFIRPSKPVGIFEYDIILCLFRL